MNNIIRSFGEFVTSKCFSFCLEKDCGSPLSDRTLFTFHMEWHMGQTSFRVQYISRELTARFFCYFESHAPSLSHLDTNRDTWEPIIYREEERDELLLFGFSFLLLYYICYYYIFHVSVTAFAFFLPSSCVGAAAAFAIYLRMQN